MGWRSKDVTDAELAVLQAIWNDGPSTIRRLTESVYPKEADSQYSTVKQLLARLEAKGFVRRDRRGFAHVFSATLGRDVLVGQRLERLTESLCDGTILPLLPHLVNSKHLTEKQRQMLLSLIEELEGQSEAAGGAKKADEEPSG
jgi:BlaI family transcriptional regulator, penicillinase repressor